MSIGFLLGSPDDAIIWRGPKKNGMIRQFLSEVDWGNVDYLLIDTPPGKFVLFISSILINKCSNVKVHLMNTCRLPHIYQKQI